MAQKEFEGRKIMVFGASSGIGRACAIQLGGKGANLVLVGRNREKLEETASHIPEGASTIVLCDVRDFDAAEAAVKDAVKLDGVKLDGCVFSAGIAKVGPVVSIRKEVLHELFQTNFFSFVAVLKAFASRRVSQEGASFVSISSITAIAPFKGQSIYTSTKAAINAFTAGSSKELSSRRIRVNTVCPEMVNTPMGEAGLHLLSPERVRERYPLGILGPEDIADTVNFLLSDASKKITGQAFCITAGSVGGDDNIVF